MRLDNIDYNQAVQQNDGEFLPLPEGQYPAVYESDLDKKSAANHVYLEATFRVTAGPYVNRKIWHNMNIHHPNPTAAGIAIAELKAIFEAAGFRLPYPSDTRALYGKAFTLSLVLKTGTDSKVRNQIKAWAPANALPVAQPGPAMQRNPDPPPFARGDDAPF